VNGRKLSVISGLLRNSTKIATQFLGLGQCSQKAPGNDRKLEQRPDCSQTPSPPSALTSSENTGLEELRETRPAPGGLPEKIRPRLAQSYDSGLSVSTVRVPILRSKMVELRNSRIV
jgi:hypothetical protein